MPRRIRHEHKVPRQKTYLRQWREHAFKSLTLEEVADRYFEGMSGAQLSRIERGVSPYTQDILELAAYAYKTTVPSLLMRDPSDPDALWSILDNLKPAERREKPPKAKIIRKTGT